MAACLDEIRSHTENGSWKWVELPEGASAIGSRWVFKVKRTEDGSIERYKARLVAQGFSQRPGWDFVENFAPTIRLSVTCAIFALVAAEDMECDLLDITTAFLNGDYMKPPPLFEQYSPQGKRLYCLLDLGPSKWFLGIHITRDRAKRTLS